MKITFLNKPKIVFFFAHINFKQFSLVWVQPFVYTQLNDQTVLFQTIQFSMSIKLNGSKYCYVSLTIQLNQSFVYMHLKEKQLISNNSV